MKKLAVIILILAIICFLSKPLERSTNEAYIKKLNPDIRPSVKSFLKEVEQLGYTAKVRDTLRTFQEQSYYKKIDSRNASAGSSSHEFGNALDVDFYKDGKVLSKNTNKLLWLNSGIIAVAQSYGIKWGGNFKNYADNNHFYF